MKDCPKWEKWETDILKKYYGKIINSELRKKYLKNKSMSAIQTKANSLGLRTYIKFSEKHKRILALRNKRNIGKTFEEIYGEERAKQMKEKCSIRCSGEGNPAYKDGTSRFPYPLEWNNRIREQIRQRDKKCVICEKQDELRKLCVHHIDRKKDNLNPDNLICLCIFHHAKICVIQDDIKDHFYARIMGLI